MVVSRFVNWWFLMIIVYISVLLSKLHIVFSFVRAFDSRAIFFLLLSLFPSIILYFVFCILPHTIWSHQFGPKMLCAFVVCMKYVCVWVSIFFFCAVIFFYLRWCSLLSIHFLSLYPCAITACYCWCCCCYFFGCCFKTQALIMSAICAV